MPDQIKYSDIISPDVQQQLDQLTATIKQLTVEMDKLNKATEKEDETSEDYSDTLRKNVEITKDLLGLTRTERELKDNITEASKKYNDAIKKETVGADKLLVTVKKGQESLRKHNFEVKNAVKLAISHKGSMTQLSLELANNRMKYRELTKSQRENRSEGKKLLQTIKRQDAAIKKLDKSIGNNQRNVGDYGQALGGAAGQFGVMGTAMRSVTVGMNLFRVSIQSVKTALISSGIGAFVVMLGSLYSYFTSTGEGALKFQKILAPFKVTFQVLSDLAADLGEYLFNAFSDPKQLVTDLWGAIKNNFINRIKASMKFIEAFGDILSGIWELDPDKIKKSAEEAGNAYIDMLTGVEGTLEKVGGAVDGYNKSMKQYSETIKEKAKLEISLLERERELALKNMDFTKERAKLEVEIAVSRLKFAEMERTDREAALIIMDNAKAKTIELYTTEKQLAEENVSILRTRTAMFKSTDEELQALADAEAELIRLNATQANGLRKLTSQYEMLRQSIRAAYEFDEIDVDEELGKVDQKILIAVDMYKRLEELRKGDKATEQEEWEKQLETIQFNYDEGVILYDEYIKLKQGIDEKYFDWKNQKEEEEAAKARAVVAGTIGAFAELGEAMGLHADAVKALRIAETTINTYSAAIAAYNSAAQISTVGWILGPIAAAGAIAVGLANIAKIKNTEVPKFAKGTEFLTGDSSGTDRIPIMADYGERIVPSFINKQMMGVENIQLPGIIAKAGLFDNSYIQLAQKQLYSQQEMTRTMKRFAWVDGKGNIHYLSGDQKNYV